METPIVYHSTNQLLKVLKKKFKPFKTLIKDNTTREQRFPMVGLINCPKLDKCSAYVELNGYNHVINDRIRKVSKKLLQKLNETNVCDSSDSKPNKRRKLCLDSVIDLNVIYAENEELDFEEESNRFHPNTNTASQEKVSHDKTSSDSDFGLQLNGRSNGNKSKLNGFLNKTESIQSNPKKSNSNHLNSSYKNCVKPDLMALSVYNPNCNNGLNFKIPKKDSQNIETIISHANHLIRNTKRCVDAFTHLQRYLTEDQWTREDVIELLANIAKAMASNSDFGSQMAKFNDLMDRMKGLAYTDDDFWDQIIYSVDKKKNDVKCSHQISSFLSGLYDYMIDHKICARVVCNEAVIIAFRSLTNHPTAKDLLDL